MRKREAISSLKRDFLRRDSTFRRPDNSSSRTPVAKPSRQASAFASEAPQVKGDCRFAPVSCPTGTSPGTPDNRTLRIFDTARGEAVRSISFAERFTWFPTVEQCAEWRIVVGTMAGTHVIDPATPRDAVRLARQLAAVGGALDATATRLIGHLRDAKHVDERVTPGVLEPANGISRAVEPAAGDRGILPLHVPSRRNELRGTVQFEQLPEDPRRPQR